jgi:hypothetical protein
MKEGDISPSPATSPRVKHKPPPLIFANEILSSCTDKDSSADHHHQDDDHNIKIVVPLVNIEYATPVLEHLPKFPSIHNERVPYKMREVYPNIIIEHSSSSVGSKECPLTLPMITINQSSEAESDSDTPALMRHLNRPNLCFLSPFAGASDRVPSESNLSTSGYSSMASPCPSRCPSISPLCPSEVDDYHSCSAHGHNLNIQNERRASFTPGTPGKKLGPLGPRRSSLNATSGLLCDNSELCCQVEMQKDQQIMNEIETDSAVEVDIDCVANTLSEMENPQSVTSEEMKYINALLQVPRKGLPKSRSLDISVADINSISDGPRQLTNDKKRHLRGLGPSLDSKLNSFDPSSSATSGVTIIFPLSTSISNLSSSGRNKRNLIEIPEEKKKRLSPVSSRSESPLSELSATGCFSFLGSPLTDSDGVYDCGSSEVPTNNNETDTASGNRLSLLSLNRLNPPRKSSLGRKKDRKQIGVNNKLLLSSSPLNTCDVSGDTPGTFHDLSFPESDFKQASSHLHLPPNLAKDLSSTGNSKRGSPKRRTRAQPVMDASSSSSESLASNQSRHRLKKRTFNWTLS